jgi:hypothetical protein
MVSETVAIRAYDFTRALMFITVDDTTGGKRYPRFWDSGDELQGPFSSLHVRFSSLHNLRVGSLLSSEWSSSQPRASFEVKNPLEHHKLQTL